jgi:hypothetical protein
VTKNILIKRVCLLVLAAGSVSCANVSDAVDQWTTVGLGADEISPVQIDRSLTLGPDELPACLDFSATIAASNTSVALANSPEGCSLTVGQPDLVLMDEQAVAAARKKIQHFDVDGVRTGSVVIQKVELSTADGGALALADYVDAITVQVDGNVLLDRVAPADLQNGAMLTRQLPGSVIDKLKDSLKSNQAATADVVLTLWLHGQRLVDLPPSLHMLVVLQPQLQVNVVDAAF